MSGSLIFQPELHLKIQTRDLSKNASLDESSTDMSISPSTSPSTSPSILSTSTIQTSTEFNITNSSFPGWTTTASHPSESGSDRNVVIMIISLLAVAATLIMIYAFVKKGKFINFPCCKAATRARRSSSSSSKRALEEHEQEVMDEDFRQKPEGQADDTFTIDDLENNVEVPGTREEYYYDEVFGQSQFEDEATNNAMRQLYSDPDAIPEEEILDLDFETLGIRIQDYSPDPGRKNIV